MAENDNNAPTSSAPKLHIDSDWKAEAQKEKERLTQKEQAAKASKPAASGKSGRTGGEQELPEPSFRALVGMLASQAIMGLGAMADPQTNRVVIDLEGSRFAIDLLDVLDQKTQNNLNKEEADELKQILVELRSRFVQISQLVAKQMAAQAAQGGGVALPVSGGAPER